MPGSLSHPPMKPEMNVFPDEREMPGTSLPCIDLIPGVVTAIFKNHGPYAEKEKPAKEEDRMESQEEPISFTACEQSKQCQKPPVSLLLAM